MITSRLSLPSLLILAFTSFGSFAAQGSEAPRTEDRATLAEKTYETLIEKLQAPPTGSETTIDQDLQEIRIRSLYDELCFWSAQWAKGVKERRDSSIKDRVAAKKAHEKRIAGLLQVATSLSTSRDEPGLYELSISHLKLCLIDAKASK